MILALSLPSLSFSPFGAGQFHLGWPCSNRVASVTVPGLIVSRTVHPIPQRDSKLQAVEKQMAAAKTKLAAAREAMATAQQRVDELVLELQVRSPPPLVYGPANRDHATVYEMNTYHRTCGVSSRFRVTGLTNASDWRPLINLRWGVMDDKGIDSGLFLQLRTGAYRLCKARRRRAHSRLSRWSAQWSSCSTRK